MSRKAYRIANVNDKPCFVWFLPVLARDDIPLKVIFMMRMISDFHDAFSFSLREKKNTEVSKIAVLVAYEHDNQKKCYK